MTDQATPAKVRLTDGLGPLPEYGAAFKPRWPGDEGGYTAQQMHWYALDAVAAERERWTEAVMTELDRRVRPRATFEAWISAPPYEREVERFGDGSAWPGNYREIDVDLAWQAWSAAAAVTLERCATICEGMKTRPPGDDPEGVERGYNAALRRAAECIRGPNAQAKGPRSGPA